MKATVVRMRGTPEPDGVWDKPDWRAAETLVLDRFMGTRPAHVPDTRARLGYDDAALYVIFRVADRFVRAVARQTQDPVCRDSCVEFFFSPGPDASQSYFNLEMNCGGTLLFEFHGRPRADTVPIAEEDCARIRVAHTLPKIVDPEIPEPVVWSVEYRLPLGLLRTYAPVRQPAPGARWRGNLYKCGDATSHPHWLTWAPVDRPGPDFHVPQDFGVLEFA